MLAGNYHFRNITCILTYRAFHIQSISQIPRPHTFNIAIIGGGIIGLATARELALRHPQLKIVVLEKEKELATHQTAHNCGVIHTGVFYPPGSLKAKLCTEGLKRTYSYLDKHKLPYKICGKLIVAVDKQELPILDKLMKNAKVNGVTDTTYLTGKQIHEVEPHCYGLKAIYSPYTGIVDWKIVALTLANEFLEYGGTIFTSFEAESFSEADEYFDYPVLIRKKVCDTDPTQPTYIQCQNMISCAGLQADRLALKTNCSVDPKIIPFRGNFLKLVPEKSYLIKGNIYPVPDLRFPFLGIHFTPHIDGSVWLGPDAVLTFKREGYKKFNFDLRDAWEIVSYPGVLKFVFKYYSDGLYGIYQSLFLSQQLKQLQRFLPQLRQSDLVSAPSGIRAQAIDINGELIEDFVIHSGSVAIGKRIMHVRNAPSPGATCSLSIARLLVDDAEIRFDFPRKYNSETDEV